MKTIEPKLVVELQAEYLCKNCGNHVRLIGNSIDAPVVCGNCNSGPFVKLWSQKITTQTTIEALS